MRSLGARHRMHFSRWSVRSASRSREPVTRIRGADPCPRQRSASRGFRVVRIVANASRPIRPPPAGAGTLVRRSRGDERARPCEPLEDAVGILVAQDRGDDDVVVWLRQPLEQPVDGLGRVRAVPHLAVAAARAVPGKRRLGRHRPPRKAAAAASRRRAARRGPHERRELAVREHDDRIRPGDGELLARDRSRVSPSTSVCSRPTFVSRTTRRRRRSSRRAARRGPLRSAATCTPRAAKSRARPRSASRTASRRPPRRPHGRARARSKPGRVGLEPLVPAGDVRRG